MFAYCENNPVMFVDPNGRDPGLGAILSNPLGWKILLGVLAFGGAILVSKYVIAPAIEQTIEKTVDAVKNLVESITSEPQIRDQSVYVMRDKSTDDVRYVGRTNNPTRRQREHEKDPNKANLKPLEVKFSGLTVTEARAIEQSLISAYLTDNLLNARREIAKGNVSGYSGKIENIIRIFEGVAEDEFLNLMGR